MCTGLALETPRNRLLYFALQSLQAQAGVQPPCKVREFLEGDLEGSPTPYRATCKDRPVEASGIHGNSALPTVLQHAACGQRKRNKNWSKNVNCRQRKFAPSSSGRKNGLYVHTNLHPPGTAAACRFRNVMVSPSVLCPKGCNQRHILLHTLSTCTYRRRLTQARSMLFSPSGYKWAARLRPQTLPLQR